MSIREEITAAVAAELTSGAAAGVFGYWRFTAQVLHVPVWDWKDLKTLHVSVVPRSYEEEFDSRGQIAVEMKVDVAIQMKLTGGQEPDADMFGSLSDLVESVIDYLRDRELNDYPDASWQSSKNDAIYLPDHLRESQTFTSIVTLTYRTGKDA